ncbi:2'-5' RNA ligase family protein [Leptolyngbya sp. FACHB-541]|uniref:2'-5' RNA ligase family protein n=1 Tax=Leptolyngbya sp. FACHB-541 TaxID=2692810 RepID=UPI00168469FB|nr:2'-5' RNA ligase family protein [Leptolyngbya sp. FACHB-541]MBD1995419.1 2'-5' RNA ligase family protein [Leptolyngbya sp. FACHB-541]
MSDLSPLILTLKLDQKTFSYFDQLRQQHFPPERNFLSAHITLFHALPGEQKSSIQQTLQDFRSHIPPLTLTFTTLRFLGKGVAVEVECPELIQLRQQLATHWHDWLSRQDQQGYRPHITIQNKVTPDQARLLYDQLVSEWKAFQGTGEGLLLWYYKGGPWELANQFDFK